ncbi:MAG: hypothetical protein ABI873_12655 [Marmoricola sp.]
MPTALPRRATVASVQAGEPAPLYIGDARWMRHVVLVVRAAGGWLSVYDPRRATR